MQDEKPKYEFLDRPSIPMDDRLKELGDALLDFIEESESLPEKEKETALYIGRMEKTGENLADAELIQFYWGYSSGEKNSVSLDSLRKMKFENSLDSLIDYPKGFRAAIYFIFPLIECIRMNLGSEKVFIIGDGRTGKIFM